MEVYGQEGFLCRKDKKTGSDETAFPQAASHQALIFLYTYVYIYIFIFYFIFYFNLYLHLHRR